MSRNVIIAIIIVLLLVLAAYFFMGKSADQQANTGTEQEQQQEQTATADQQLAANSDSGIGSFMELLGMGRDVTCSFSTDGMDAEYPSNGTMYTSGGKYRVDSISIVNNEEVKYSMIDDGTNMYMWGESLDGEFAMKMAHMDIAEQSSNPNAPDTAFDYSERVEYDCDAGSVSDSQFVPPSDIEFMDMDAMRSGAMDAATMERMMQQYGGGDQ